MIELGYLVGVALLTILALVRWRTGILATLVVGFLSDPVRKVIPDEPLYFNVLLLLPLVATMLGAYRSGVRLSLRPVFAFHSALRWPLALFVVLVAAQSLHAFVSTGSPVIAAIGLVAYLAPVPGILIGYHYARTDRDVRRFFRWHVGLVAAMGFGVYLARAGYDWELLDAVGEGLVTWSATGQTLFLQAGFFRAPEIAAWHLATAMCLITMLAFAKRRSIALPVVILGTVLPFLALALIYTGRRKSVVMFAVFLLVYLACVAYFRRGAVKTAVILGCLALGGFLWMTFSGGADALLQNPFVERGTRFEEVERFERMSWDALSTVVRVNGAFGSGAGTGSQGAQYFGGGASMVGRAAEGGLAKILAELGIPGLVVGLWVALALLTHMWKVARVAARSDPARSSLAFGMSGYLVGNALIFTLGHQVFGDAFVLYVLGSVIGFMLAIPRMAVRAPAGIEEPPDPVVAGATPHPWATVPADRARDELGKPAT